MITSNAFDTKLITVFALTARCVPISHSPTLRGDAMMIHNVNEVFSPKDSERINERREGTLTSRLTPFKAIVTNHTTFLWSL